MSRSKEISMAIFIKDIYINIHIHLYVNTLKNAHRCMLIHCHYHTYIIYIFTNIHKQIHMHIYVSSHLVSSLFLTVKRNPWSILAITWRRSLIKEYTCQKNEYIYKYMYIFMYTHYVNILIYVYKYIHK
jgi:hypothetical protein